MVRPSAVTVRRRAPRVLATLGVLVAAVLALSTVTTAPSADAATVLGQFRNAAGRCLENLNNATTANNKIQINACGTAATARPSSSAAGLPTSRSRRRPDGAWAPEQRDRGRHLGGARRRATPPCRPSTGSVRTDGLIVNRQAVPLPRTAEQPATHGTAHGHRGCTTSTAMRWTVPAVSTPTDPADDHHHAPTTTTTTTTDHHHRPADDDHHHDHAAAPGGRDPIRQPFASNSIWNMPIGSGAVYVPANLPALPGGQHRRPRAAGRRRAAGADARRLR